jgi:ubiquinone biosynthesis protein
MVLQSIDYISQTYRNIKRYKQILTVFAKYGFTDILETLNIEKYLPFGQKILAQGKRPSDEPHNRWQSITAMLEELGPSFVKLGQILSDRPDILPKEFIAELEKLHDSVKPFDEKESQKIVEEELGAPITDLFKEFDIKPVNSASMAQVHKAILKTGEEVAIKVQRPDIKDLIETDIEIMFHFAGLMERYLPSMDFIDPVGIVEGFERSIKKELNFNLEATHFENMRSNFKSDDRAYIPLIYRELTTEKVLTIEFIHGIKISHIDTLKDKGYDPHLLADYGAQLVLTQIFDHGYFHADPHPGNILVLEKNVLCFLDLGMVGILTEKQKHQLGSIIIGMANKDSQAITKSLMYFSENPHMIDTDKLEREVLELVEEYYPLSLERIDIQKLLFALKEIIFNHKLKVAPEFYILLKALISIEGIGRKLNPDFNLAKHIEPFAKKMFLKRFSPEAIAKSMYLSLSDLTLLLRDLPTEVRTILHILKTGKGQLSFEHRGLTPMLKAHQRITNRIVLAIVLSALIIGSSLIILSKVPPTWYDIPIIGIAGFVGAAFVGFWLLVSMIRS